MDSKQILSEKNVYDLFTKLGCIDPMYSPKQNQYERPATVKTVGEMLCRYNDDLKLFSYSNALAIKNRLGNSIYERYTSVTSTGTGQYLDTGYIPGSNTSFDLSFRINSTVPTGGNHIFSINESSTYFALRMNNGKICARFGTGGLKVLPSSKPTIGDHYLHMDKGIYTLDGDESVDLSSGSFKQKHSVPIMCYKGDNGKTSSYSAVTVYFLRIYEDGVLVRNYVPVKNTSKGNRGLYDFVNKNYITNSGRSSLSNKGLLGNILM